MIGWDFILADGTKIERAYVVENAGVLWFYVRHGEYTMADLFALMNDPEKTARITAHQYGEEHVYTGFTDLQSIQKDERQISGGLRKVNN